MLSFDYASQEQERAAPLRTKPFRAERSEDSIIVRTQSKREGFGILKLTYKTLSFDYGLRRALSPSLRMKIKR
jgi:hypothetical protein